MIERQKRFAAHYAETGNGAEAARRAGYSEAAARQTAYKLRQKDSIKQVVEREQWFSDHDSCSTVHASRSTGSLKRACIKIQCSDARSRELELHWILDGLTILQSKWFHILKA